MSSGENFVENMTADQWQRLEKRLARVAYGRLPRDVKRRYDENDAAGSAIKTFWRREDEGIISTTALDADSLWRLLAIFVLRKARRRIRFERQQKRDSRRTIGEDQIGGANTGEQEPIGFEEFLANNRMLNQVVDDTETTIDKLMPMLSQDEQRLLQLQLDGDNAAAIAAKLGVSKAAVYRKLKLLKITIAKVLPEIGQHEL